MTTIRELNREEFDDFEKCMIEFYAEQSVAAGRVREEGALEWSTAETRKFLPKGFDTPDNVCRTIRQEEGKLCGYLWCGTSPDKPERAHLFAICVFDQYRGRGIGTEAMKLLELELKKQGYSRIGLHVYTFNTGAVRMYRKLGYQETDLVMMKTI